MSLHADCGSRSRARSEHLRMLREVELVRVREAWQQRLYGLDARGLEPVHEWVIGFEQYWVARRAAGSPRTCSTSSCAECGRHDPGPRWQRLSEPIRVEGDRAAGAHRLAVRNQQGRSARRSDDRHAHRARRRDRGHAADPLRHHARSLDWLAAYATSAWASSDFPGRQSISADNAQHDCVPLVKGGRTHENNDL